MKRFFYFSLLLGFGAFLFTSNSSGAGASQGADRTGSPVANGTCANCHQGGNFGASVTAQLRKEGQVVTSYIPGETYKFRVIINTTTSPAGYGFQSVALVDSDNANAGTFMNEPSGTRITTLSDRLYFEHRQRLTTESYEIDWMAPANGTGDVSFYAVGNAVNGSGTSGDEVATLTSPLTISEEVASSVFDVATLDLDWNIYPNPVADAINMNVNLEESDDFQLRIIDQTGRLIRTNEITLNRGENRNQYQVSDLNTGIYFLQLVNAEGVATQRFLKK